MHKNGKTELYFIKKIGGVATLVSNPPHCNDIAEGHMTSKHILSVYILHS